MLSEKHEATKPAYTIVFLDGATIIASTPWGGDLPSAKQLAMDHFAIDSRQRGATEVVVLEAINPAPVPLGTAEPRNLSHCEPRGNSHTAGHIMNKLIAQTARSLNLRIS